MKKEYVEYISLFAVVMQLVLGVFDVLSDIDYAVNAKKSSREIEYAALFFVCF